MQRRRRTQFETPFGQERFRNLNISEYAMHVYASRTDCLTRKRGRILSCRCEPPRARARSRTRSGTRTNWIAENSSRRSKVGIFSSGERAGGEKNLSSRGQLIERARETLHHRPAVLIRSRRRVVRPPARRAGAESRKLTAAQNRWPQDSLCRREWREFRSFPSTYLDKRSQVQ